MSQNTNTGIGFWGAFFLLLLALKLTNVIDWSWWWVTAPIWIPTIICIVVGIIALIIMLNKPKTTYQKMLMKNSNRKKML